MLFREFKSEGRELKAVVGVLKLKKNTSVLATEHFPFNPIVSFNLNRALIQALCNDTLWINIFRMITRGLGGLYM
jgi:hypothetical protein